MSQDEELSDDSRSSRNPGERTARGWSFERRVELLLQLHGYSVEPEQLLGGNKVDLVARLASGLEEQVWWIECKDHARPIAKEVLEKVWGWVSGDEGRRQHARGMVVAKSFTPAAMGYAKDHREIRIWTVDELEKRLFDPRIYLQNLVRAYKSSPLADTYVHQRVLLENRPAAEAVVELLAHAGAWAHGAGNRLWLLLGDYGTGKSVFFRRFGYELAKAALADPEAPIPIAIDLKEFPNATSAETLFFEHLKRYAPDFRGNSEALRHLLAAGRAVLLLDGFDEMGVAAAGRSVDEQFRELARLAGEEPLEPKRGNRVLVTCRTHFFRDQQQVKDAAAGKLEGFTPKASEDSALGRLARRFDATIDELQVFDDEQIAKFLALHLGKADAERAEAFIEKTYDLKTLAPRPVLLEMIVKSLPTLWNEKDGKAVNPAGLYEHYTRLWLEDRSGRNLETPPVLRHRLLQVLAASLWRKTDRQMHHRELLEEVERMAPLFPGLDYTRVDVELRTAAFLVRSAEGYYRFSHKSFLEYFLAGHLWAELGVGAETAAKALDLPPLTIEVGKFFWELTAEGREERLAALRGVLQAPYRVGVSENALRLGAWSWEVTEAPFRVERAQLAGARLEAQELRVELPGADLSRALLRSVASMHLDLTGARMPGAQLQEVALLSARFDGADLTGADFSGADLGLASFKSAKLKNALLLDASLWRARFDEADLTGADLSGASGENTSFLGAQLKGARLAETVFSKLKVEPAELLAADTRGWVRLPHDPLDPASRVVPFAEHPYLAWLQAIAISPDSRWLASDGDGREILIRDLRSGVVRRRLTSNTGGVFALAWSGDGRRLASADSDGRVRLWEPDEGRLELELAGHEWSVRALAWSGDGRLLASAGDDAVVRVWEPVPGREIRLVRELAGHSGGVLALAWSWDGRFLASGGEDAVVRVWEPGREGKFCLVRELPGHQGTVVAIAWCGEGGLLASMGEDALVRIWDSGGQGELHPGRQIRGYAGSVWALAWGSEEGRLVSAGDDGVVRFWEPDAEDALHLKRELPGSSRSVWALAWTGEGGRLLSAGEDTKIQVWEPGHDGVLRLARELPGHTGWTRTLAWSDSERCLVSAGGDEVVRVWEFDPSGEPSLEQQLSGHAEQVWALAWRQDCRRLASAGDDAVIKIWESGSPTGALRLAQELFGHSGRVWALAWSGDGQRLVSASDDKAVRVWEPGSGGELRPTQELSGHSGCVLALAWSVEVGRLASAGEDGVVRVWESDSAGDLRLARELLGHTDWIRALAWSGKGGRLASAGDDAVVRIWESASGALERELFGHAGIVWALAWSGDGRRLASAGDDGRIRIWDVEAGQLVAELSTLDSGLGLVSIPGGFYSTWNPDGTPGRALLPREAQIEIPLPNGARYLPLGPLAEELHQPEKVRAALAAEL